MDLQALIDQALGLCGEARGIRLSGGWAMTAIAEAVFVKFSNPWLNCLRSTTRGVCGRLAPPCAWHRLGGAQNAAVAAKKSAAVARKRRVPTWLNRVCIDAYDPGSKQPEFKICAVRLEKA